MEVVQPNQALRMAIQECLAVFPLLLMELPVKSYCKHLVAGSVLVVVQLMVMEAQVAGVAQVPLVIQVPPVPMAPQAQEAQRTFKEPIKGIH